MPVQLDPYDLYEAGMGRISNMNALPGGGVETPLDHPPTPVPPTTGPASGIVQQAPDGSTYLIPDINDPAGISVYPLGSAPGGGGGGGGGGAAGPQGANANDFNIFGDAHPFVDLIGPPKPPVVPRWNLWAPQMPERSIASLAGEATASKPLRTDPQLPELPQDASLDSMFYAEEAMARQQMNQGYQDILSQYGYDKGGVHIPGAIELAAGRQERDLLGNLVRAQEQVTGQMQQAGTVFSGYHTSQLASQEQPYITGLGDLAVDVPKNLASQVEKAQDLMRSFILQRNLLMQQALLRYQALLASRTGGGPPGTTPTSTPTTTPPRADQANYDAWVGAPAPPGPYDPTKDYTGTWDEPFQPHYGEQ